MWRWKKQEFYLPSKSFLFSIRVRVADNWLKKILMKLHAMKAVVYLVDIYQYTSYLFLVLLSIIYFWIVYNKKTGIKLEYRYTNSQASTFMSLIINNWIFYLNLCILYKIVRSNSVDFVPIYEMFFMSNYTVSMIRTNCIELL